jgi:hypothetical protein
LEIEKADPIAIYESFTESFSTEVEELVCIGI